MKLKAFTLIEVILAMAVVSLICGFGLVVDTQLFRSSDLRSEKDLIANLLKKARSESMNNINGSAHGLHVGEGQYLLFQGADFETRDKTKDLNFSASPAVKKFGVADVVFAQLSGSAKGAGSINILGSPNKSITISVNTEGQINSP